MIFAFEGWELDAGQYELREAGQPRKIEPLVFDLLHLLVRNHERVVGRDEIVAEIWQGRIVTDATISTCLKSARQVLRDDGRNQRLIRTVHGRGFRFVGEVAIKEDTPTPTPAAPPPSAGLPPLSGKPVIAVLPFDNLSADVDEYFADGLTEDIITNCPASATCWSSRAPPPSSSRAGRVRPADVADELGARLSWSRAACAARAAGSASRRS